LSERSVVSGACRGLFGDTSGLAAPGVEIVLETDPIGREALPLLVTLPCGRFAGVKGDLEPIVAA
jgi:hypothetical protein